MTYHVTVRHAEGTARLGPFQTLQQASEAYCALRDDTMEGASTFGEGRVFNADGALIHRISYNGRVWKPGKYQPGDTPIYDPTGA